MIFFNMLSPSACPRGSCQAEPYSGSGGWHAERNLRMYSAPLGKCPEMHVMHNGCNAVTSLIYVSKIWLLVFHDTVGKTGKLHLCWCGRTDLSYGCDQTDTNIARVQVCVQMWKSQPIKIWTPPSALKAFVEFLWILSRGSEKWTTNGQGWSSSWLLVEVWKLNVQRES